MVKDLAELNHEILIELVKHFKDIVELISNLESESGRLMALDSESRNKVSIILNQLNKIIEKKKI